MTQKRKLEERIMEGPPRGDITFEELKTFLSQKGAIQEKGNASSHQIFVFRKRDGTTIRYPIPCHLKDKGIGRAYIKAIRKLISDLEDDADGQK